MTSDFTDIQDNSQPSQAGMNAARLDDVIAYAQSNECTMNRDIGAALAAGHFGEPPEMAEILGPVKPRGPANGIVLRNGQVAATWGDPTRVDMTFSISKSYLALLTGLAVDDGLIPNIHAPVRDLLPDIGFDSDQNAPITWDHLLTLTSEWEGTLWDKPDWVDHNRRVPHTDDGPAKGTKRAMRPPGTHWEYNDVRVNQLSYALMCLFKRPLPEVLKTRIMDPISAQDPWEWHGYRNSWVEIDGTRMQSVSGGGHWGGGLWISARDHARVGMLMLNKGVWQGNRILSEGWITHCHTPCDLNPGYGRLWWLNTNRKMIPAASENAYFGLGVGGNTLWVDPDENMIVVSRWLEPDRFAEFGGLVMAAL